jgi:pantetheine-phosphate adenylyltransferase
MAPDNRTAVCPGSYDPVTNGHLDIISRASAMYDKLIVAVVNLPTRKGGTLFTIDERVEFIRHATERLGNVEVEPFSVLTVDFARSHGAKTIIRGLRAISDFEYELELDQLNRHQAPDIESVYLMASAKYSFIRSSGVKELATFGGRVEELVPAEVAVALQERIAR